MTGSNAPRQPGEPEKLPPRDPRDRFLDHFEHRVDMRQRSWTVDELARSVEHVKGMLTWVIILLIVNLLATLYIADFVHQIVQAVHSL